MGNVFNEDKNRCWYISYVFNISIDCAQCFDLRFRSSSDTCLWSIMHVIKVDCHDLDPYYAMGVCCCKNICSLKDSEVLLLTYRKGPRANMKTFFARVMYCSGTMLWVWYITRKNIVTVNVLVLQYIEISHIKWGNFFSNP